MTWRDLLAATGAGLVAAAMTLGLSWQGEVVAAQDGGAIAGLVHGLLHGVTLVAAVIGLLLALVVRLDDDVPGIRLRRLRRLRQMRQMQTHRGRP
jgi:hypothetical protein